MAGPLSPVVEALIDDLYHLDKWQIRGINLTSLSKS